MNEDRAVKMTAMISDGLARQREEDRAALAQRIGEAIYELARVGATYYDMDEPDFRVIADAVLTWIDDRYE